jgi:hypothetical protein
MTNGAQLTMFDLKHSRVVWKVDTDDERVWFAPDGTPYTAASPFFFPIRARSAEDGSIQYALDTTDPKFPAQTWSELAFSGSHILAALGPLIEPTVARAPILVVDWPVNTTDLAEAACKEARRNLTQAEWTQYVGDFDPYEKTCGDLP